MICRVQCKVKNVDNQVKCFSFLLRSLSGPVTMFFMSHLTLCSLAHRDTLPGPQDQPQDSAQGAHPCPFLGPGLALALTRDKDSGGHCVETGPRAQAAENPSQGTGLEREPGQSAQPMLSYPLSLHFQSSN